MRLAFPRQRSFVLRGLLAFFSAALFAAAALQAQIPGRNVNMVSGISLPDGDPYLQRQNEPSIAASTRNPLHLLGGSNDYRTVDIAIPDDGGQETGDAWLGLYRSMDGGLRWASTLLPGYPQEPATAGLDVNGNKSPLKTGGYSAAADPVVRAGTNGLFYYGGLAFDRGPDGKSAIFMARFIDNNNREDRDAIQYLGTSLVATAAAGSGRFLDKPWVAVDIPRGGNAGTCRIVTPGEQNVDAAGNVTQEPPTVQSVPAGTVYVGYTSFWNDAATGARKSEILLSRSYDCGVTWQAPMRVSRPEDPLNQGLNIAIDPRNGQVYVAWRRFSEDRVNAPNLDGMMVARLPAGGRKFNPPGTARRFPKGQKNGLNPERLAVERTGKEAANLAEFDQGTGGFKFRTNAYPVMAIDGDGRVYMAWSERGFAFPNSSPVDGDARIVMVTTTDGTSFTQPKAVDNEPSDDASLLMGHQVMPSLAFAGGKIMLVYYDLRETKSKTFGPQISDELVTIRNTIDIRAALGTPGEVPVFGPSVKVSEYLTGFRSRYASREQLQFNPPNLPMFKQGTAPFMGDYIDVTAAPAFVPGSKGRWAFNTAPSDTLPIFHAVWTDNRDVRAPTSDANQDGNPWNDYTPVQVSRAGQSSPIDECVPGNTGSRNQNIYTSRLTGGLMVGSPGNAKPLSTTLQRGFVVFAQNQTRTTRTFRMTVLNQPPGGRASFEQFPLPPYTASSPAPRTVIELRVPARSSAVRTVYVTSSDPRASVAVDVSEIAELGGAEVDYGLDGRVVLNPDIENPDIENPDIENPDIENPDIENPDIENVELYNPDIENPDIENPDIENPDIENPDIENPDIENPDIENIVVANPDIENPDIENPDIENPDIENPDIENPDIENVTIGEGVLTDITWNLTNAGNTTTAFNVNLFLSQAALPTGLKTQLILHKSYRTPVAKPGTCQIAYETRNVIVANIPRPTFVTTADQGIYDQNDPDAGNATMALAPGEAGKITLRIYDPNKNDNVTVINDRGEEVSVDPAFNPETSVTPGVISQGVDPQDPVGTTEPPIKTPTGANLFFVQQPSTTIENVPVSPAVAVQVRDNASGTPVAGSVVTLMLAANPGNAVLSGNVASTGPDGIAMFPGLTVSAPGSGYVLMASATGAGEATALSVAFNVSVTPPAPTIVTTTSDAGPGSLRAAMTWANTNPGADTITFDIQGAGPVAPAVITVSSPLPPVSEAVVIDGTTQPGYDGLPVVEISGGGSVPIGFQTAVDIGDVHVRGLAVTRFTQHGVLLLQADTAPDGTGHRATYNYIGTDRFGTPGKGNGNGLTVRRDDAVVSNNVFAGNSAGVVLALDANDVLVQGNHVGLLPNGTALGNQVGVRLTDYVSRNVIDGNYISGNANWGIQIVNPPLTDVTDTTITSNVIGLNAAGASVPNGAGGILVDNAPGTRVGVPGKGNTISGNANAAFSRGAPGIAVFGTAVPMPRIQSNYIGVDSQGTTAQPNTEGIWLYGPALVGGLRSANEGNLIAGNGDVNIYGGTGINVGSGSTGAVISGNTIGLTANQSAIGNGSTGLTVYGDVSGVVIGGATADHANIISGSSGAGIALYGPANAPQPRQIDIQVNSMHANGGLGIDLDGDNITLNDAGDSDTGANGRQNFPVLSNVVSAGPGTTSLAFDLTSFAPGAYTLRFYANLACDGGGHGEGERWVGTIASGAGLGNTNLNELVPVGQFITATATDAFGNTSEFSACAQVAAAAGVPVEGSVFFSGTPLQGVTVSLVQGNPTDAPLATDVTDANGFYGFQGVAPGTYWVRADGPDASYMPWQASQVNVAGSNVNRNIQLAKVLTLTSPANNQTGVAAQPTLTWNGLPEAQSYTIQINHNVTFAPIDPGATTANQSYNVQTVLTAGDTYRWQVDAYDGLNRHVGSTVQAFRFTVQVASAVQFAGPLGGSGGTPFGPLMCPVGEWATGVRVATDGGVNAGFGYIGYALTAAELICSGGSSTPKFGGGTTPNADLTCAPGDRMVGMVGSLSYPYGASPVAGGIAPRCQTWPGGAIGEPWAPLPSGVSTEGPFDCPAGQVVKGVQGGQGAVVDRVVLVCGTP